MSRTGAGNVTSRSGPCRRGPGGSPELRRSIAGAVRLDDTCGPERWSGPSLMIARDVPCRCSLVQVRAPVSRHDVRGGRWHLAAVVPVHVTEVHRVGCAGAGPVSRVPGALLASRGAVPPST